ncbi:MAG TPA: cytochrome b/b6 domain-containing protein [Thermoanaerobaculia bacterium]|jgi:thiosulfate reductase cytochrome b subunit|nr:cytochrome b/b6 domain-containing protein [Thermoanaerobaculia bacterium]
MTEPPFEPSEPTEQQPAEEAPPPAEAAPAGPAASAESVEPEASAEPEPVRTAPARRPLVKRHHWLVRTTHWLNAVLLAGMIMSGLQIYHAFPHFGLRGGPYYVNHWDGKYFPRWARLGGWLAGGLNWHFALAWPFVLAGLAYLVYLIASGEWRSLLFRPRDVPRAWRMQLYYLRLRKEHPPQGKHNALQKAAYSFIFVLGVLSVLTGFAIYKPVQLWWLTAAFGGYELARYWHFWAVWIFVAFTLVHVALVFLVDPASLRAMITGWYRGRFPSHD